MNVAVLAMVMLMTNQVLSKAQDWALFNSSLLIEVTREKGVFTCTGVALTPTLLATAAHCLEGDVKRVRVFTNEAYDPKAAAIAVERFELHPEYRPKESRYRHDIARIVLSEKLPASVRIHEIFQGQTVAGEIYRFGFGARNKKNLRTVITPKFRRLNLAEEVVELDDTFSRSGDSGGPVFIQQGYDIKVLAIHSTFSHGPQGRFSFNPLLQAYRQWLFPN
jgi:hypothetical protein